jgi:hypothetical protein
MQAEGRREKLLFALFCILSVLVHGVALVAFAGNVKFHKMSSETSQNQEPIQVATIEMPPPSAEPIPPDSPPPPSQAMPLSQPPRPAQDDSLARRPKPTPTPNSKPTPALAATPKPSPSPSSALASPTPTPVPSPANSGEPTPAPSPTPVSDLPEGEAKKKTAMQKFFEAQDLEVPQELPPGFKSWDEFEKFMTDGEGFEKKASDLMKLPDNTSGSENAGSGNPPQPNGSSAPDSSGSPDNSGGPRSGYNPGWFNGSNRNNIDPNDNFDSEEERRLRARNLGHIDTSLELDPLPAIPLPKDWQTNDIGYHSVRFLHDDLQFFVRWESALQPQLRKAEVQYYPPANPKQTANLSLKWQEEWDDVKKLIGAVQLAYEQQKQAKP